MRYMWVIACLSIYIYIYVQIYSHIKNTFKVSSLPRGKDWRATATTPPNDGANLRWTYLLAFIWWWWSGQTTHTDARKHLVMFVYLSVCPISTYTNTSWSIRMGEMIAPFGVRSIYKLGFNAVVLKCRT